MTNQQYESIDNLRERIAELEAQLAAAREDTARLVAMIGYRWIVRPFEGRNGERHEVYTERGIYVAIDAARGAK